MNNNNSKKSNTVTIIAIVVILVLLLCCAGGGLTTVFIYNKVSNSLEQKLVDDTDIIDDTDFIADTDVIADTDIIDDTDDIDDIEGNKESNLDLEDTILLYGDNLMVTMDLSSVEVAKKNEEKRIRFTIDAENKGEKAINVEFEDIIINDELDPINVSIDVIQLGSAAEYDGKAEFDYNKDVELILDGKYKNEEVKNIKFRFKVYDPETYETIFKTSYCELDLSNNESVATLITEATEQEDDEDNYIKEDTETTESNTETTLYGTEKVGYVTLDGVWANFDDVDIANSEMGDMVQYTNGDVIVTLNVVKNGDPENSIKNLAALEEGTRTKIDIGKYDTDLMDAHYVYQEYDDGYKLYITCFTSDLTENEEDMIYLAIESPLQSEDEFVETVNNIQESHSYGYFYDFFSLSNRDS